LQTTCTKTHPEAGAYAPCSLYLETQKERLVNYANAKGYKVSKVYSEVGSGFNDK